MTMNLHIGPVEREEGGDPDPHMVTAIPMGEVMTLLFQVRRGQT